MLRPSDHATTRLRGDGLFRFALGDNLLFARFAVEHLHLPRDHVGAGLRLALVVGPAVRVQTPLGKNQAPFAEVLLANFAEFAPSLDLRAIDTKIRLQLRRNGDHCRLYHEHVEPHVPIPKSRPSYPMTPFTSGWMVMC